MDRAWKRRAKRVLLFNHLHPYLFPCLFYELNPPSELLPPTFLSFLFSSTNDQRKREKDPDAIFNMPERMIRDDFSFSFLSLSRFDTRSKVKLKSISRKGRNDQETRVIIRDYAPGSREYSNDTQVAWTQLL